MEEVECPDCPVGIPAWVMTFADLMSLLMCFFVLLLSFSEMDALKFKRLAGSMAQAFGVQNRLNVTIANLGSARENLSAANSRIRDVDFAQETAELTRNQVLQQAGISVLAQANVSTQSALSLLG